MILIKKGREPKALTEYKLQEHAYYDGCPKKEIRESLLAEQGNLCAYCMRRIDKNSTRIEHWKPESVLTEYEKLDYKNMLGVCLGHIDGTQGKEDTCDAKKGDISIIVNPLDINTLSDIYYSSKDGRIYSKDPVINMELDKVLNLNSDVHSLPINRKTKLDESIKLLHQRYGTKNWTKNKLEKFLEQYSAINSDGNKNEYLGIVVWHIKRIIERH